MKYINRNSQGKIVAVYALKQYKDQEELKDDDPEILEFDLNLVKLSFKINLSNIRDSASSIGIMYEGNKFYSGPGSNNYFLGSINYLNISSKTELSWKTMNGNYVTVSLSDLNNLFELNSDFIEACFSHESVLLGEIDNATTIEELESIDLNAGWPDGPPV